MFLFIYKKFTDVLISEVDSRKRIFKMAVFQFFQQWTADVLLSIYLSIHSAAPSFRVLRAVALSVQELKERL